MNFLTCGKFPPSTPVQPKTQNQKPKSSNLFLFLLCFPLPIFNFSLLISNSSPAIAQAPQAPWREGFRLWKLGIQQRETGQVEAALQSFQQALVIFQSTNNNFGLQELMLGEIAGLHLSLSKYGKAIEYYEQNLAIVRKKKNLLGEGRTLNGLGSAYFYLGNYGKAIEYYEQYLVISRYFKDQFRKGTAVGGLGLDYPTGEGAALENLGLAYQTLGNDAKAIKYYEQFLASTRERKDLPGEGAAMNALGNSYQNLGNYTKAVSYHEGSLAIFRKINRQTAGKVLGDLSISYLLLGIDAKANEYAEQSLTILRERNDRQTEGTVLGNLGRTYSDLGNYDKAISYLSQALKVVRELKDQRSEGFTLQNLAVALIYSGDAKAGEKTLFDSLTVLETIRQTGVGNNDTNKVSIFETQAPTYRMLQRVLVAQNKINSALEVSERGRGRAFVELLAQRVGGRNQEAGDRGQESRVNPPNLVEIQQIARAQNAVLVQYSIMYDEFKHDGKQEAREAELYIWVIQPTGGITFRKADLRPLWQQQSISLESLVDQSRGALGARSRSDIVVSLTPEGLQQSQENRTRNLKQLHQLLIQPIADLLPKNPSDRVIFIPQSALFLVPFPALQAKDGKFLIEQHTILTAPSIQVLDLTRQQRKGVSSQESGGAVVVGNPTMPRVRTEGGSVQQLSKLVGAEEEAKQIAALMRTQPIIGQQATKSFVMKQLANARWIHLATHGLLDDFKGMGVPGAIALGPDGTGQENDGLLTSDEILNMKLKAELVVLSACDTGQGRITGDGVIGLSRSLITAGVPSIIVSLWKVPDASTAFLMTEFYKYLQQGDDKAQALRQAMLSTKAKYRNPLDWAAFTLIGEAK